MLKLYSLHCLIFNKYINHWFLLEGHVVEPIVLNLRNKINHTTLRKRKKSWYFNRWLEYLLATQSIWNKFKRELSQWLLNLFLCFYVFPFKLLPLLALGGHCSEEVESTTFTFYTYKEVLKIMIISASQLFEHQIIKSLP